jgi:hypothetical protein
MSKYLIKRSLLGRCQRETLIVSVVDPDPCLDPDWDPREQIWPTKIEKKLINLIF